MFKIEQSLMDATLKNQIHLLKKCLGIAKSRKSEIKECLLALEAKQALGLELASANASNYASIKAKNTSELETINSTLKQLLPKVEWQLERCIAQLAKRDDKLAKVYLCAKDKIYSDVFGEFGYEAEKEFLFSLVSKVLEIRTIFCFLAAVYLPYFVYVAFKFYIVPELNFDLIKALLGSAFVFINTSVFLAMLFVIIGFLYKALSFSLHNTILVFGYFIFCFLYFLGSLVLSIKISTFTLLITLAFILALLVFYLWNKFKIKSFHFVASCLFVLGSACFVWVIYIFSFDILKHTYENRGYLSFIAFLLSLMPCIFLFNIYSINAKIISMIAFGLVMVAAFSPFSVIFAGVGDFDLNMRLQNTKTVQEIFKDLPKCSDENDTKPCKIDESEKIILLKNIQIIIPDARGYWVSVKSKDGHKKPFLINSNLIYDTNFQAIKDDR
ncbi:hypothetical protein [Campylobacter sp. 19-13652]|uniref:hypothetical protein n=1 Tax=Campylobacter sp. 19-13652 TaxID=2840180 RepID=UPI001C7635ED|nr:hypothetical protein [Campylobacter sp. 19-13652]BCX78620.1 hypothetical protein LBC_00820 [Campylobacter sp. 19-13652]